MFYRNKWIAFESVKFGMESNEMKCIKKLPLCESEKLINVLPERKIVIIRITTYKNVTLNLAYLKLIRKQ